MSLDFLFRKSRRSVRETVRRLCQQEMAPLVVDTEENESFPRQAFKRWGELSLLGVALSGRGRRQRHGQGERLHRSRRAQLHEPGFASSGRRHTHLGIWPIWKTGTPEQKERFSAPRCRATRSPVLA